MFARLYAPAVSVSLAGTHAVNLRGEGLRIAFRVRRTMTPKPDTAEIAIHNLAPERRQAMVTLFAEFGAAKMTIASGYEGIPIHLFAGDVRTLAANILEGNDIVTRATADDGGDAYTEATFAELAALTGLQNGGTSVQGATADEMITAALACFALKNAAKKPVPDPPIVRHPSVDAVVAAGPYARQVFNVVSIGKASDLLDEAARILGARWWIRDHALHMATRGAPSDPLAVLLPRDHWLSEPSEDGESIVRVSTFLDPTIVPGRQVALQGRVVPLAIEHFRAEECDYVGDTHGGPFSVGLTLRRLTGVS